MRLASTGMPQAGAAPNPSCRWSTPICSPAVFFMCDAAGYHAARAPGRSCAPPGAGALFLARPVAALAGLACRPASYRRARRARQGQFFREREPNIYLPWGAG